MSDKFTPGEWQASVSGAYPIVETTDGRRVATLPVYVNGGNLADAELLARAKDLLAACRKALPHVRWVCDYNNESETDDPDAFEALSVLREVLALFPED